MIISKILYPIDFSVYSYEFVDYIHQFAKIHNAELVILHVVEYLSYESYFDIVSESQDDIIQQFFKKSEEKINEMIKELKDINVTPKIVHGIPYDELINIVKTENIDLIIMPSHGHSSIIHSIIGSLTDKVMRKAPCPVMVLKPKDFHY